jgi:hypothetical protein
MKLPTTRVKLGGFSNLVGVPNEVRWPQVFETGRLGRIGFATAVAKRSGAESDTAGSVTS